MAHLKPTHARARAPTTWLAGFPSCQQAAGACAQSELGLPADVLDRFGLVVQSHLEMPPDFRGIAIGPGALNERTTGMGLPGFGDRTLPAPLPTGGFRRGQAQIAPELSGILKAGEVTQFGHGRNGDGALPTAQGLQ